MLRDSFNGRFGEIVVAAPEMPRGDGLIGQQLPFRLNEKEDGIRFVSLGSTEWRARHFWKNYSRIRSTCIDLARASDVIHAGMTQLYQPYDLIGFCAAKRAGVTTVFVQDQDALERMNDQRKSLNALKKVTQYTYSRTYYLLAKNAISQADLSLLKGSAVNRRYARFAKNARNFFDTSYSSEHIISTAELNSKISGSAAGGEIRCLALGRLLECKSVDHSIQAVAKARDRGARVSLDIIGDGVDTERLKSVARNENAEEYVRFLGSRPYGTELLEEIRKYHVLLFTSLLEETPRSLFDGIAAGCGLLSYDLQYSSEVIDDCKHGRVV